MREMQKKTERERKGDGKREEGKMERAKEGIIPTHVNPLALNFK